ncbi:hypothetical protein [Fibrobacter sp. UWH1]|uniref:hypothetical protein n=1 Tax=Fibrobacter sp. UWH1 TaxID=1964354 RepID=UPI000B520D22|nr:hypothetical protein [Fibrobacter sp. UWH1]OWV14887.1 hypothetical protein B7992_07175 [Fibrobacter sp. UWH1]
MKFAWILALVMAASSFALDTYECKDLYGLPGRASYFIVPIGTRERASYTEYDDKKVCERDAAQMEAHGNAHKKKPMPKDDEGDNAGGFVETLVGLMNEMKTEQGWRQSDGTLLWEKLSEGGYYCYDKNGMNAVKRVKEAKWCK